MNERPFSQELSTEEQVIRGTVRRVTFHNPDNGYSVLQVTLSGKAEPLTVVGTLPRASVGSHIIVRGSLKEHPRYGKQLSAISITETAPSSSHSIEKYLGSGFIKGIGVKTAQRLVSEFGEETLEVIYKDPEKVAKATGIGRHKVSLIRASIAEQRELQEVMRFLLEHDVTQGLATKIYGFYKNKAVEILSKDPYCLARDIRGIGFVTADAIAMKLGLAADSPQRLRAGIFYALEKSSEEGHCFLPGLQLMPKTKILLGLGDEYDAALGAALEELLKDDYVICDEDAYYLRYLFKAEEFVGSFVSQRLEPRPEPLVGEEILKETLRTAESELNVTLSPDQREAVRLACNEKLLVITGGPGCGKTTIIRALSLLFRLAGKRLSLAAPTGRAAQRMAQVCSRPASTIHRLLKYDPSDRGFLHGINDPLPTDAVIIDEASMIDILLARDLFSAIPKHATLILVGDKDQLPSVGPGRVFADLISVKEVRTIALSQLFRRAEESTITSIAHQINCGIIPDIPTPDGQTKCDAYFIAKKDTEEAATLIEKLVSDQLQKKFDFQLTDITVLTPSNRGDLGTERLNLRIQAKVNPTEDSEQELQLATHTLKLRDRVCQRVNNYQIDEVGVFNGDVGEIFSVDRRSHSLTVELWDGRLVKYTSGELSQLSLAYSMTVHRAQGSEIPCVVLALHDSHYTLLDRQLIYTAITRAKKLLVVVGSKRALAMAVKRTNTRRRLSQLAKKIKGS